MNKWHESERFLIALACRQKISSGKCFDRNLSEYGTVQHHASCIMHHTYHPNHQRSVVSILRNLKNKKHNKRKNKKKMEQKCKNISSLVTSVRIFDMHGSFGKSLKTNDYTEAYSERTCTRTRAETLEHHNGPKLTLLNLILFVGRYIEMNKMLLIISDLHTTI